MPTKLNSIARCIRFNVVSYSVWREQDVPRILFRVHIGMVRMICACMHSWHESVFFEGMNNCPTAVLGIPWPLWTPPNYNENITTLFMSCSIPSLCSTPEGALLW